MTQELILIVLLTGFVGLVWVMTLAILDGDHPRAGRHESSAEDRGDSQHQQHHNDGLKQNTIAA